MSKIAYFLKIGLSGDRMLSQSITSCRV